MPPSFHAVATRSDRVRVVFSESMLNNADLRDPTRYVLSELGGSTVSIASIYAEQNGSGVRSTLLRLGASLVVGRLYRLRISLVVTAEAQETLSPDQTIFQWAGGQLTVSIPFDHFSGEVTGELYGEHRGLVFFSPALESAAANSVIQVEQVEACSKAYDQYHMPPSVGPQSVLTTYGAAWAPTPGVTTLNSSAVLWSSAGEGVRHSLGVYFTDNVSAPTDGPATATLIQSWPPNRVALLNNPTWKLFKPGVAETFITADNLTAFPASAPVIIPL